MSLRLTFLPLLLACLFTTAFAQLEKLENFRLVPDQEMDADSFIATNGVETLHLRIYYADAPETSASDPTMARRVREQTRYFGLDDPTIVIRYGNLATEQVKAWLAEPFTVHTARARGLGRSSVPRFYAFVVTSEGEDLGEKLVRHGLARAFGVGRLNWRGEAQPAVRAKLADLELAAALGRRGIWSESNPERLVELRAQERRDADELAAVTDAAEGRNPEDRGRPVNINTASEAELTRLPGVGPAIARRIVEGRPYHSVEDLFRVRGIGPALMNNVRDQVEASPTESPAVD